MKGSNSRMISRQEAAEILRVDPQTVTNWCDKGVLRSKKIGNWLMVDRDTITALFDSLEELAESKKVIAQLQQENRDKVRELKEAREEWLKDVAFVNGLEKPYRLLRLIDSMIENINGEIMSDRERNVLKYYLDGSDFEAIGEEFGITRERTRQIIEKSLRKLDSLEPYGDVVAKRDQQASEMAVLKEACKRQDAEIAELRKKLAMDVANRMKENDAGSLGGLSESDKKMIELLNTKLADLNLSVRAMNCLMSYGSRWRDGRYESDDEIKTLADLVTKNKTDLLKCRNFGRKTLNEIDDLLEDLSRKHDVNLTFGMDVSPYYERYKNSIIENMG